MIPFAEWLPDQADLNNPGATVAKNVLPHAMGYEPLLAAEAYSDALTARCRGAFHARDKDGNTFTFAGDATKIKSLQNDGSWTDVTNTGADYTNGATDNWEFVQWGETVVATNYADAIQTFSLAGSNFADLGGSPPQAKHMAVARNFLITGNIDTPGTVIPNRVHWSGINDNTTWAQDASTQADYEDIKGNGGGVQRIFGGEYAVVFQEKTIWRMTYVGTPVIWQFDETAPGVGLLAPGMAVQDGDVIYFLSPQGFFKITNGAKTEAIGVHKLDEFVLNDIDTAYLDRCVAAVDDNSHRMFFAYPGSGNSEGQCNRMVVYDHTLDRWSYSEQETQALLVAATAGYTMDGLDSFNSNLDLITTSLDDSIWTGGREQLAKFDGDNKLGFFSGSPMAACVETAEVQMTPTRRTLLTDIRPVIDGGSSTIEVGTRNLQTETESWTTPRTPNSNGRANVRKNARYHRVRANISGDWTHAQGVEAEGAPAGWR